MTQKSVLWAFLKLVRLDYSLYGALGVFLSGFLAGDIQGFQSGYFIAFLIVLFSATGAFALNDYSDFELDKRNERFDRPLVLGLLPRKLALITGLASFFLALTLSMFLNPSALALVLISLPLFFLSNHFCEVVYLQEYRVFLFYSCRAKDGYTKVLSPLFFLQIPSHSIMHVKPVQLPDAQAL